MLIGRFARRVSSACNGDWAEHLPDHTLNQSLSRGRGWISYGNDAHLALECRRHGNNFLGCKQDAAKSEQDAVRECSNALCEFE